MGRARRLRYRHLRRTIIAVLATLAAALLLGLVVRMLLQAGPTRRLARHWLVATAGHRGIELEIADLSWGLVPPRVRLDGVRVTAPGLQAEIEHGEVDLARLRLTRQTVVLGTVAVDGVRVRLTELPKSRRRAGPRLKIRIQQLQLSRLELEGSNLPGKIDLELDGVNAGWSSQGGPPSGYLRVDEARADISRLDTIRLAVAARMVLDDGLSIPVWTATGPGVALRGHGHLGGGPGTALTASGTVDLAELDRVLRGHGLLDGSITIDADLDPDRGDMLRVEVRSHRLEAAGFPVDDVAGRLVLDADSLRGELDRATFHGGLLSGAYHLDGLRGRYLHRARVRGRGVDVAFLLRNLGIPPAGVAARLDAEVDLEWSGRRFKEGSGHADARLTAAAGRLPAAGPITVDLVPDGTLVFAADGLRIGGSVIRWQGPLAIGTWQPAWSVTASPAVLEELVPMVNTWIGSRALPSVAGVGRLQVTLSGPWRELVVGARLDARPLRWDAIVLDHVVADALIAGGRLTLAPSLYRIGDGNGEVEGSLTWDPAAGDEQLDLDIRGHRIPLAVLAAWIGQEGMAGGVLSFTGGLNGPLLLPRGSWAAGLDDVVVGGLELGDATATVNLADARFEARGVEFDRGLTGQMWWQVSDGEVGGDLGWPGMPLDFLGDTLTRTVGTHADVRLAGRLARIGYPSGQLSATTPAGNLEVKAEPDRWLVRGRLGDAADAAIELDRVPDGHLAGTGTVRLSDAENLLARVLPESKIPLTGTATMAVAVDWREGTMPVFEGTVEELGLDLQGSPVELLAPAHLTLSEAGLEVPDLFLGHRNDRVFLRWSIGADGTIKGNATGAVDALLLRFLIPEWEPAGRATGVVEMLGSLDEPRFEGIAEIAQGSFRVPGGQTIVSGINGTVLLSEDELAIDGSDFRFMQGRGRASGRVTSRDGAVRLDLDGVMSGLRYQVFPGLEARVDGSWRLTGSADRLHLSGDLTVSRTSLQRRDDPAAVLLDWFGQPPAPPAEGGVGLDLRVESDQTIELRNPFVRLVGSASLHVTGTTNQPGLVGKVELEEGGEISLQNLRYELERGTFTFADPDRVDPIIELQLRTWVQNYQVTLRLSGTSDRLVPQVTSNPPLPQEEVYSLLAMGYRGNTLGSGAMGVGVASTILSQQITSELDRRAKLVLPVDQVRVDPFAENAAGGPAARVTVVKQLAPNWTVTLQSNLSAERAEVIVSRWYLAPGLFVEATRELDGSYGIDLKIRRPY
jgi:hypothetical protein